MASSSSLLLLVCCGGLLILAFLTFTSPAKETALTNRIVLTHGSFFSAATATSKRLLPGTNTAPDFTQIIQYLTAKGNSACIVDATSGTIVAVGGPDSKDAAGFSQISPTEASAFVQSNPFSTPDALTFDLGDTTWFRAHGTPSQVRFRIYPAWGGSQQTRRYIVILLCSAQSGSYEDNVQPLMRRAIRHLEDRRYPVGGL